MISLDYLPRHKPGEKTVLVVRRHPIIFIRSMIIFVVLIALPFGVHWLANYYFPGFLDVSKSLGYIFFWMGLSLYAVFIWLFLFARWLDFYLDAWILTNERIVSIELRGLFARTVAELDFSRVQDVTDETKGIWSTLFRFGNVYVQTAGEQPRFVFRQVPDPDQIRAKIIELQNNRSGQQPAVQPENFDQSFPRLAQTLKK